MNAIQFVIAMQGGGETRIHAAELALSSDATRLQFKGPTGVVMELHVADVDEIRIVPGGKPAGGVPE